MSNIVPECSHLITYIGAWVPFISVFHIYFSIISGRGNSSVSMAVRKCFITTAPVLCGKPFTCFQWCFTWNKTSYWSSSGHKRNIPSAKVNPHLWRAWLRWWVSSWRPSDGFESEHMRLRLTGMYCVAEHYSLCAIWKTSFADLSRLCQHKAAISTEM